MTLTEFLLARITEDGAVALKTDPFSQQTWYTERRDVLGRQLLQGVDEDHPDFDDDVDVFTAASRDHATHIVRFSPARVLAECEAKRRIVELHASALHMCPGGQVEWVGYRGGEYIEEDHGCRTLGLLALPYVDHADYDEAWRP